MADILPFKKTRANSLGLCQHGHHKWKICNQQQFDYRSGKLITRYRCERCGAEKVRAL